MIGLCKESLCVQTAGQKVLASSVLRQNMTAEKVTEKHILAIGLKETFSQQLSNLVIEILQQSKH